MTNPTMFVIYGLYCTCHPEASIRYVGQTSQGLSTRFADHRKIAKTGMEHRVGRLPIYRWMRKHGIENIACTVLEEFQDGSVDEREVYWINRLSTFHASGGLNMTLGGMGKRGYNHSDLTKSRMSRNKSGRPGFSKSGLTVEIVERIKLELWSGETVKETADRYGVSAKTIKDINQSKCWNHVNWPIGPRQKMRTRNLLAKNLLSRDRDKKGRLI